MTERAGWRQAWHDIWQDAWLRALVGYLPLLLFVWMVMLFNGGQARQLPIGLVDLDHSSLSRQVARSLQAVPALHISDQYPALAEGASALRRGEIYALVLLPHDFEKQVRLHEQPVVTAFYNSQFLLIGRVIGTGLQQALGAVSARLGVATSLIHRPVPTQALGDSLPIQNQLVPLYNAGGNYAQFLVAGLLPSLWQMLVLISAISLLSQRQRQGLPNTLPPVLWRLGLIGLLCWGWGGLMLGLMFGLYGWPLSGGIGLILLAQGLMVSACLAVGAWLFLLTRDGARAMSLAAGYSAPAFAFLGVTFPVSDMGPLARGWRALLPAAHYTEVQIGQADIGLQGAAAWWPLGSLLLFSLLWWPVLRLLRRAHHA